MGAPPWAPREKLKEQHKAFVGFLFPQQNPRAPALFPTQTLRNATNTATLYLFLIHILRPPGPDQPVAAPGIGPHLPGLLGRRVEGPGERPPSRGRRGGRDDRVRLGALEESWKWSRGDLMLVTFWHSVVAFVGTFVCLLYPRSYALVNFAPCRFCCCSGVFLFPCALMLDVEFVLVLSGQTSFALGAFCCQKLDWCTCLTAGFWLFERDMSWYL